MDVPAEICTCSDATFQLRQRSQLGVNKEISRPSLEPRLEPNTWHVHFRWRDLLCSCEKCKACSKQFRSVMKVRTLVREPEAEADPLSEHRSSTE